MKFEKGYLPFDKTGGFGYVANHSSKDDLTIVELDEGKGSLDGANNRRRSYELNH